MANDGLRRHVRAAALLAVSLHLAWSAVAAADGNAVRGHFENLTFTAPPAPGLAMPPALTVYSGGVWGSTDPQAPGNGTLKLMRVGFGQPFANSVPYVGFVDDAIENVRAQVYPEDAPALGQCSGTLGPCRSQFDCPSPQTCDCNETCEAGECQYCVANAALRYKDLVYGIDDATPTATAVNLLEANVRTMADFYDSAERARLIDATRELEDALKYAPTDLRLRQLLLDIYYDRAVAELMFAKEDKVASAAARFLNSDAQTCDLNTTVIDDEIDGLQAVLGSTAESRGLRFALEGYFELLTNGFSVDTGSFDPQAADVPFGSYVFRSDVPARSQYAATYLDPNTAEPTPVAGICFAPKGGGGLAAVAGSVCQLDADCMAGAATCESCPASGATCVVDNQCVTGSCLIGGGPCTDVSDCAPPPPLFSGYKDLTMVLGLLEEYADTASQLARLMVMRGSDAQSDIANAQDLIRESHQLVLLDGQTLLGIFTGLPGPGDPSGVDEAIRGWRAGLTGLTETAEFINGNRNVLGFADDFLMLTHPDETADGSAGAFDSFDNLKDYLDPSESFSPLGDAVRTQQEAFDGYSDYRGQLSTLTAEFDARISAYRSRLTEIVGYDRGTPEYERPFDCTNEAGTIVNASLICQQLISIDIAKNRIQQNAARQKSLDRQLYNEIEFRSRALAINNTIEGIQLKYGNRQSKLTLEIYAINAAQKFADNMAASAASAGSSGAFTGPNVVGAAAYAANAAFQFATELGKGALQKAKDKLAAAESAEITVQNGLLQDIDFERTIKNLMIAKRELLVDSLEAMLLLEQENSRLVALLQEKTGLEVEEDRYSRSLTRRWFADPLHRLTAQAKMVEAQNDFLNAQRWMYILGRALEYKWNQPFFLADAEGNWSLTSVYRARTGYELDCIFDKMVQWNEKNGTLSSNAFYSTVSFRKDIFGYSDGRTYVDPVSGQTVSAVEAFRSRIGQFVDADGRLDLEFSTALFNPLDSNFFDPELWNDKIDKLQVALISQQSGVSEITATLRFGGTALLRDLDPGSPEECEDGCVAGTCLLSNEACSSDADCTTTRPDHVCGEYNGYSTRFWYFGNSMWQVAEGYRSLINLPLTSAQGASPACASWGGSGVTDAFRERSVAATGWNLAVRADRWSTLDLDQLEDIEFRVCHKGSTRPQ